MGVVTDPVVTVNAAPRSPGVTVTLAGTTATGLLLESEITTFEAVTPFRVTKPCAGLRELTAPGSTETADKPTPTPAVNDNVTVELAGIETLS